MVRTSVNRLNKVFDAMDLRTFALADDFDCAKQRDLKDIAEEFKTECLVVPHEKQWWLSEMHNYERSGWLTVSKFARCVIGALCRRFHKAYDYDRRIYASWDYSFAKKIDDDIRKKRIRAYQISNELAGKPYGSRDRATLINEAEIVKQALIRQNEELDIEYSKADFGRMLALIDKLDGDL